LEAIGKALLQEVEIRAPLDEADVLALPLVRYRELEAPRDRTDLVLREISHRKERLPERVLREAPENVGLILRVILRAEERRYAVRLHAPARVVAGRHELAVEPLRRAEELPELEPVVALDAGVRGAPREVLPHEILDDVLPERLLEIEDVVGKSEPRRHAAAIIDGVERAAAAGRRRALRVAPELHRDADDGMPALLEERRGDGGVDAAAHGDEDGRRVVGKERSVQRSLRVRQEARVGEPWRSFSTTPGTMSRTRSISASVVHRPRLNRTADCATLAGTPIARRTCDGWDEPALHAAPLETAMPFMSRLRMRCSPSAPTNETCAVLQTRGADAPWRTICLTRSASPASRRSRSAAMRGA